MWKTLLKARQIRDVVRMKNEAWNGATKIMNERYEDFDKVTRLSGMPARDTKYGEEFQFLQNLILRGMPVDMAAKQPFIPKKKEKPAGELGFGLSDEEIKDAKKNKITEISFGKNRLRSETAAIYGLSILKSLTS